jgi:hypothetical protein
MSRPILPWRSPLEFLPLTGKEVWIRRLPWYDRPILARGDGDSFTFTFPVQLVPEGGNYDRQIAFTEVHTWKYRYLADEEEAFPPTP